MKRVGRHRPAQYTKHKITKHRTLEVPEGFEFLAVEKHPQEPKRMRIVFRKKR
jgi:hypothetical protein